MPPRTRRMMRFVAAFVRLSRLKFLIGGFAAFGLGVGVAAAGGARITLPLYAAGQAMVTAFHLMTHYANEYFDREGDRRGGATPFSGGSGVLVSGALPPATALLAALGCAALGAFAAAGFALAAHPAPATLGAAIGLGAWFYSAPPLRLAARGWGEIDAALVVAILVPLAGYAIFTGRINPPALAATAAPACAMFAMMIAVEWPDHEADAASGKANMVVRFGSAAAARLAAGGALLIVPALLIAVVRGAPWPVAVGGILLVPLIAGFVRRLLAARSSPPLEIAMRGVSLFLLTVVFELFGYVVPVR